MRHRQGPDLYFQIRRFLERSVVLSPQDRDAIGRAWVAGVRRRIDQQVDLDGNPLQPLSAVWSRYKARHGYDPRIWRKTGQAYASVRHRVTMKGTIIVECKPRDRLGRGYAGLINDGYTADDSNLEIPPGSVVPPRRVFGLDAEDIRAADDIVTRALDRPRRARAAVTQLFGPSLSPRGALERAAVRLFR